MSEEVRSTQMDQRNENHALRIHSVFLVVPSLLCVEWQLGCLVVRTSDLGLSVVGSLPSHDTAQLFLRSVTVFGG